MSENKYTGLGDKIVNGAQDLIKEGVNAVSNGLGAIGTAQMDAWETFDKYIMSGEVDENGNAKPTELYSVIREGTDKAGAALNDLANNAVDAANGRIDKVQSGIDELQENLDPNAVQSGIDYASDPRFTAPQDTKQIEEFLTKLIEEPVNTIKSVFGIDEQEEQEIKDFVERTGSGLPHAVLGENRNYINENGKLTEEFFEDVEEKFGSDTKNLIKDAQDNNLLTAKDTKLIAFAAGRSTSPSFAEKGQAYLQTAELMEEVNKTGEGVDLELENGDILSFEKGEDGIEIYNNGEPIKAKDAIKMIAEDTKTKSIDLDGLVNDMIDKNQAGLDNMPLKDFSDFIHSDDAKDI